MASDYDNTNRFALFPNDRMRHGHNDPDLKGYINIDDKEYWFQGWTSYNEDDTVKYINGSIGDEREKRDAKPAARKTAARREPAKSGRR